MQSNSLFKQFLSFYYLFFSVTIFHFKATSLLRLFIILCGKMTKSTGKKEKSTGKKEHSISKKEHSVGKKDNSHGKKEKSTGKKAKSQKTVIQEKQTLNLQKNVVTHSSSSSLDSNSPSTVLDEMSSVVGSSQVHSKTCSPAHHHGAHKTPESHHGGGGGGGGGAHHGGHNGHHSPHSPHASHVPSMDIANMQRNVPHSSRIVSSSGKSSKVSVRSRVRHDPRADPRPNENVPIEASADSSEGDSAPQKDLIMESCLEPTQLYSDDVRSEFQPETIAVLVNSEYDPEQYLKKAEKGEDDSYLARHVDPQKLTTFIVNHMEQYYDISKDGNPLSVVRQQMDNYLWDNLAYIIPMLCRDIGTLLHKEPMIIPDVEPNALIFGDLHGNFNDLFYIYKNFINNAKYASYRFVFLGDYVDRGPKPVEICCLLFALKLAEPKRFILLRGNHEASSITRKNI